MKLIPSHRRKMHHSRWVGWPTDKDPVWNQGNDATQSPPKSCAMSSWTFDFWGCGGHKVVKNISGQWLGNSQMDFHSNDRNGSPSSNGVLGSTLCFWPVQRGRLTANSSTTLNVQIRKNRKTSTGLGINFNEVHYYMKSWGLFVYVIPLFTTNFRTWTYLSLFDVIFLQKKKKYIYIWGEAFHDLCGSMSWVKYLGSANDCHQIPSGVKFAQQHTMVSKSKKRVKTWGFLILHHLINHHPLRYPDKIPGINHGPCPRCQQVARWSGFLFLLLFEMLLGSSGLFFWVRLSFSGSDGWDSWDLRIDDVLHTFRGDMVCLLDNDMGWTKPTWNEKHQDPLQ